MKKKLDILYKKMIDTQALYKRAYMKGASEKQLQKIADKGYKAMAVYVKYKKSLLHK
jgi:hypothetical protein